MKAHAQEPVSLPLDPPSVAFYYGAEPPLADLQAFDIAVVEPDFVADPRATARTAQDGTHELFAYVSLGEVQPSRPYYKSLPPNSLRASNAAWNSRVIDQTTPGWSEFFLSRIVAPLWEKGWRGFFIDTLDSYQLFAKTDAERTQQVKAMVALLREFKRRYPEARLMLNRGFELLPEIAPITYAVAAESLYQGYDAGRKLYRPVPKNDHDWLLGQMETVRDRYHLPVISIEYVSPDNTNARILARTTAAQVRSHGFIPWVADGGLASMGVGSIEVLPRTVLILVDNLEADLHYTEAQRFLGMPLNYLGLRYEFVDMGKQALPDGVLTGRYAGIVSWLNAGIDHPALAPWLKRRIKEGIPIAVFNTFGFPLDAGNAAMLGLRTLEEPAAERLSIQSRDAAMMDFEVAALPDRSQLEAVQLAASDAQTRSLMRLQDNLGNSYDAAALTRWGGYALSPFTIRTLPSLDQNRWILQPIKFLKAALQLPDLPVPDVTTEGGLRMLMAHVDADGFASRAELPGQPFASEVMQKEILERYRLPTAVSVIEGEISSNGVYKNLSAQLEPIARRIFAMPQVEAASHTYSHPFNWALAMKVADPHEDANSKTYNLPLPGYRFNLDREIQGSIDYINLRLLPPNKKARMLLWSGNCVPPAAAIAETYRDGLLNMNGGDTRITESNKSWTAIAAQGIRKDGWYQVFAPNQNENVYTNNWSGPFYGYERVIETYQLTETPYRFKPVDIYYHVYSASKPASLAALHKVYGWATAQAFTRVYPSQYIQKVMDFEATTLARDLASGDLIVRTGKGLRTLRLPSNAAAPSLLDSNGIAGIAAGPNGAYLTLAAAQVRLSSKPDANKALQIQEVNGSVSGMTRRMGNVGTTAGNVNHANNAGNASSPSLPGQQLDFTITANERVRFTLAQARSCSVVADGKPLAAVSAGTSPGSQRYALNDSVVAADALSVVQQHIINVRCNA